jgi:hypothetical protein
MANKNFIKLTAGGLIILSMLWFNFPDLRDTVFVFALLIVSGLVLTLGPKLLKRK